MFNKFFQIRVASFPQAVWVIALWSGLTGGAFAATDSASIQGTSALAGAAAGTLGDAMANICASAFPFADTFAYLSYTIGVFFVLAAIHYFKLHAEDPRNNHLNRPLMLCAGATCLMLLPGVMTTVAESLSYTVFPSMAVCFGAGAVAGGPGLDGMLAGFISNIKAPLMAMVQVIANVAGVYMLVRGLVKMSKYGFDPKTHSPSSILANIGFGAILFTIGGSVTLITSSVFGTAAGASVLSWSSEVTGALGGASAQFQTAVNASLSFVQIIGFIAFVRGWMIMKKIVEGGGNVTVAQAITHIIGGVLAINIFDFLPIMDKTFGTGLLGS